MQKRAIETRRNLLEAAVRIFAKKGLSGATVDEIALECGANKQRIYAYFGSKKGLFEAAILHIFEKVELFSRSTVAAAAASPENLTEILLRGFLDVHAMHPCFWRLLSWANLEGQDCMKTLERARKSENEALRKIFDQAMERGILKRTGFDTYLFTLLAVSYFYYSNRLTLSHTLGVNLSSAEWRKRLCDDLNGIFTS